MSKRKRAKGTLDKKFEEVLYVTTIVFAIIIIFVSIILIMKTMLSENNASQVSLSEMKITSGIN